MATEPTLRLLSRPDCGLCEEAAALLRRLRLHFVEVNIDEDAVLRQRYNEAIPVLLLGDTELARAPITEASLRAALMGVQA